MLLLSLIKRSLTVFSFFCIVQTFAQSKIDSKALVERHTITNNKFDSLSSLSVGNGNFAFTVDVTGMQSFPDAYAKGVPLGTQSTWGWHSFVDTANYQFSETLKDYQQAGRKVSYSVQIKEPERKKNAVNWFRQNPHRLQLGNIGFEIIKKDGKLATIDDIQNVQQTLNLFTGEIHSKFAVENIPVEVITYGHQQKDVIGTKIYSPLIKEGRLHIKLRFPNATGNWADFGNEYRNEDSHISTVSRSILGFVFRHQLDTAHYFVSVNCFNAVVKQKSKHYFLLTPALSDSFDFSVQFVKEIMPVLLIILPVVLMVLS